MRLHAHTTLRSSASTSSKALRRFSAGSGATAAATDVASLTSGLERPSRINEGRTRPAATLVDGPETQSRRPRRRNATRRATGDSGLTDDTRLHRLITMIDSITDTVDTAIVTITNTPSHVVKVPFTRYNLLSNRLSYRLYNPV